MYMYHIQVLVSMGYFECCFLHAYIYIVTVKHKCTVCTEDVRMRSVEMSGCLLEKK